MTGQIEDKRVAVIRKDLKKAHFYVDAVMESINSGKKGSIIYEGDVLHIYLFDCVFSGFESWIEFDVVPKLPYKIFHPEYFLCPECDSEVVSRTEPYDSMKGWFLDGLFCENCNKWTLGPIGIRDDTVYTLLFSSKQLKNMKDCEAKREFMNQLDKLSSTTFFNSSYTKHLLFVSLPRCRQSTMPPHRSMWST